MKSFTPVVKEPRRGSYCWAATWEALRGTEPTTPPFHLFPISTSPRSYFLVSLSSPLQPTSPLSLPSSCFPAPQHALSPWPVPPRYLDVLVVQKDKWIEEFIFAKRLQF
ncbi:hypothetical protein E2C01_094912 [Portunus trituberculatus]|uniref:Uncharacterized protein n=1 Tax=Portunus trituberculatus TaxID=210409 RepID=A0A5B7JYV0_PORTR|nr:hypothetical protein [Portunus trituberculatus]